jgi:hypothetical protein
MQLYPLAPTPPTRVAEMPLPAMPAAVRPLGPVAVATAANQRAGFGATDEDRLRATAALAQREVSIDELPIVERHAGQRAAR